MEDDELEQIRARYDRAHRLRAFSDYKLGVHWHEDAGFLIKRFKA